MFQWQLQEHSLDKVRKQKGGHQLCELHGVQELITKIDRCFHKGCSLPKTLDFWNSPGKQALVPNIILFYATFGLDFTFTFVSTRFISYFLCLLLLFSQLLLLKRCRPESLDAIFGCDHQGSCTSTFSTPRSLMHRRWCICHLQYVSSSAEMQFIICWWGKGSLNLPGLFPPFPYSSFHISLRSSVLPFFLTVKLSNTFFSPNINKWDETLLCGRVTFTLHQIIHLLSNITNFGISCPVPNINGEAVCKY